MSNISKLKKTHPFFINKNNIQICIYPILYFIEYFALILSTFITWYIPYNINSSYNLQLLIHSVQFIHVLTFFCIIYHIYNELRRELFLIKHIDSFYKYDTTSLVTSYILLYLSYIINIVISYLLIIQYNHYSLTNILYHIIAIIPILCKSYLVLYDKNYTTSIIFSERVHYTKYTTIINHNKKLEHFELNNFKYPKDVYI